MCTVIHDRGSEQMHLNRENVERLLASDSFFWLDIDQPDADDYEILRNVFKFHPLAVEDSEKFGQRAKIDDYDDYVFMVVYGAVPDDDRLVEVHCFYSEKFLVTVHRDEAPAFSEVRQRYVKREKAGRRSRPAPLPDHRRRSSTASSRFSPTSTIESTSSRTRPSSTPATRSCRRSSG